MGSVEKGFAHSDHIVTGELHIGGQEHFYLETNAILVVPKEDGEMEVFHSTQNANVTQLKIAQVTGIPSSKIVVRVKRLGEYSLPLGSLLMKVIVGCFDRRWIWRKRNTDNSSCVCCCHSSKEVR
jgi:hypothetical protein